MHIHELRIRSQGEAVLRLVIVFILFSNEPFELHITVCVSSQPTARLRAMMDPDLCPRRQLSQRSKMQQHLKSTQLIDQHTQRISLRALDYR